MNSILALCSSIVCLLLFSCGQEEPSTVKIQENVQISAEEEEEVFQYEESLPDSGLLDNVNPEEIITDDWSDEGDIELDTEK